MLPGIVREDANNTYGHCRCSKSKDADGWSDSVDLANNFSLFVLFVTFLIGQKELIFLVPRELSTVRKQRQETGCHNSPDDEHDGYCAHNVPSALFRVGNMGDPGWAIGGPAAGSDGSGGRPTASYACATGMH
jgi:hypothetical protein